MSIHKIAKPYALGLFKAATAKDRAACLSFFEQLLADKANLKPVISHPLLTDQIKLSAIRAAASDMPKTLEDFLKTLVRNNRLTILLAVASAFKTLHNKHENIQIANIAVAHDLSDAQSKQLQKNLQDLFGGTVTLNVKQQPDLMAGFVAQVGSQKLDASLKGKLHTLKTSMMNAALPQT